MRAALQRILWPSISRSTSPDKTPCRLSEGRALPRSRWRGTEYPGHSPPRPFAWQYLYVGNRQHHRNYRLATYCYPPNFLQAKIPKHFQNYGDDDSENFRRPKLIEGVKDMSESDREVGMELYRRRQVHYFYLGYTSSRNKPHFHVMGKHNLVIRNQLYNTVDRPWEGDNTSLQAQLIRTMEHWSEIRPGEAPPIQYFEAEHQECLERDSKQKDADEQMQQVREAIGVDVEGWVPNDEFEIAKARADAMKSEMVQATNSEEERREFEELWPFQDHKETD